MVWAFVGALIGRCTRVICHPNRLALELAKEAKEEEGTEIAVTQSPELRTETESEEDGTGTTLSSARPDTEEEWTTTSDSSPAAETAEEEGQMGDDAARIVETEEQVHMGVFETVQALLCTTETRETCGSLDSPEEEVETGVFWVVQELIARVTALVAAAEERRPGRNSADADVHWQQQLNAQWKPLLDQLGLQPLLVPPSSNDEEEATGKKLASSRTASPNRLKFQGRRTTKPKKNRNHEKEQSMLNQAMMEDGLVVGAVYTRETPSVPKFSPSEESEDLEWKFFSMIPKSFSFRSSPNKAVEQHCELFLESAASVHILRIPLNVLHRVFTFLPMTDRLEARGTCRAFRLAEAEAWARKWRFHIRSDLRFLFPNRVGSGYQFCSLGSIADPIQRVLERCGDRLIELDFSSPSLEFSMEWGGTMFLDPETFSRAFQNFTLRSVRLLNLRGCQFSQGVLPDLTRVFPNVECLSLSLNRMILSREDYEEDLYDQLLSARLRDWRKIKFGMRPEIKIYLFLFASTFPRLESLRLDLDGRLKTCRNRLLPAAQRND